MSPEPARHCVPPTGCLMVRRLVTCAAAFLLVASSALGAPCGSTSPPDPACDVAPTPADLDAVTIPATGEVLIVTDGLTVHRSTDGGRSFATENPGLSGRWPSVVAGGSRLLLAAGFWGTTESWIFFTRSDDGGVSFAPPLEVAFSSAVRLVDPELLLLDDGRLLLFFTEVDAARTVHLVESLDDGASWQPVSIPVIGPAGIGIEDGKAIQVPSGVVLFAYEYELVELGASHLEVIASVDLGRSWGPPEVLWGDVDDADVEPGGFVWASPDELWFVASTDEDTAGRTYTDAIVKRKASFDGGASWGSAATLVPVPDQIVFGVTDIGDGLIGLATVRNYTVGPRTAAFYRVPAERPGEVLCSDTLFVSRFEHGLPGGWGLVIGTVAAADPGTH
ncbi:MAG TPA: sialidase family protein [Methylomirabilota bacterium]|nr:sialidase family protein [Methylomirabilota bacterium]